MTGSKKPRPRYKYKYLFIDNYHFMKKIKQKKRKFCKKYILFEQQQLKIFSK